MQILVLFLHVQWVVSCNNGVSFCSAMPCSDVQILSCHTMDHLALPAIEFYFTMPGELINLLTFALIIFHSFNRQLPLDKTRYSGSHQQ